MTMKNFLSVILLFLSGLCFGQNHVITALDSGKFHLPIGDLIINKPTNPVPFADGINQVRYTNISKSFPTLREGGTIWIDGKTIGPLCEIRFVNINETTPWHITTASIKPLQGTRVDGIVTKNSYGGLLYLVQGVKFLTVDGENEAYPGLRGLTGKESLKGRFGLGATSTGYYGGYHMYSISVLDGGKLTIKGFEGEHGFSVLRVQGGSYNWTVSLEVSNFYIHDTGSEGQYIGATHAPEYAKIKDLQISNGIIARAGSEALQLQHLVGRAWIRNVTIWGADAGYLNEFQPYQDTGLQISPDEGDILIENIVIDTWGSRAVTAFGAPFTSPNKQIRFKKILMNNGRGEAIYIHPSTKYGFTWSFDSLWIRNLNSDYYIDNKAANPAWVISPANGTDKFTFTNVTYKDQPDIEYVNSGFKEPADKIKFYSRYRAKYLTKVDTLAVKYKAGEILIDRENFKAPVFVKVITDFTASPIRPKNRTDCEVITWDSNTTRSDQIGWCITCDQKPYPPDDLRVKAENYYGKLGIGYVEDRPTYESLLVKVEALERGAKANEYLYNELSKMFISQQQINQQLKDKIENMLIDIEGISTKYK